MAWHPFRNVGLKVAALALGTLLWFTVSGHELERRVPVSVSYSNVPPLMEMTGDDQLDNATVRVRGAESAVRVLGPGNLHVIVDLGEAHAGVNVIALRTDQVAAPLDVDVLQIDPSSVTVTLEKAGRANVEVTPVIDGEPAAGFHVGEITVTPRTVVVLGPDGRLKSTPTVVTERIGVTGRTSPLIEDVTVGVSDSQLRLGDTRTVRVVVGIEPDPAIPPGHSAR